MKYHIGATNNIKHAKDHPVIFCVVEKFHIQIVSTQVSAKFIKRKVVVLVVVVQPERDHIMHLRMDSGKKVAEQQKQHVLIKQIM